MDNVFGKVLQVEQGFALLFQLLALAAQGVSQEACEVSDGKKAKQIAEKPSAKTVYSRQADKRSRNFSRIRQKGDSAKQRQANARDCKRHSAGKQDAC